MQLEMYDPCLSDYVSAGQQNYGWHTGRSLLWKVNQMIMQRELKINGWQHLLHNH